MDRPCHGPVVADEFKGGNAVVVARDDFTIDNAGLHWQCGRGRADGGKPVREVSAVAGHQPYTGRFTVCNEAKAVVLYLMNPLWSAGRLLGRTRQAGLKSGLGLIGADPTP